MAVLAILLLPLVLYSPSFSGGFLWDDGDYVVHNRVLEDGAGLVRMWTEFRSLPQWYPMTHSSFWLERRVFGLDPMGYRIVNALLHGLAGVLLWRILHHLQGVHPKGVGSLYADSGETPAIGDRTPDLLCFLGAVLFVVHPLAVESVAWITERKNTLSAVFMFLSLLLWLKWEKAGENPIDPRPPKVLRYHRTWLYGLCLLSFTLALLSKTTAASLPGVIAVLCWWRWGRISRTQWLALLPMVLLAVPMGLLTGWLERHHVGAMGPEWDLSLIERLLIAGRAVWFYFGKLLWPTNLSFIYERWAIDPSDPWQWAYPLSLLLVLAALFILRGRIGRGPVAWVLLFCGVLVPALGFVNVYPMRYSFVADHFAYLGLAVFAGGVAMLLAKVSWGGSRRAGAGDAAGEAAGASAGTEQAAKAAG